MTDFSKNQLITNDSVLTPKIKDILENNFLKYTLDVGECFLDFDTMTELQQSRDIGLAVFIVDRDEKKVLLNIDQELALMELELCYDSESIPDSLPDLIDINELSEAELAYCDASFSGDEKEQREAALKWIQEMSSVEFQLRLLNDNLPKFEREDFDYMPLERSYNAPCRLMMDEDHESEEYNQGYVKRHHLRYYSVENFKSVYYEEFFPSEEE